MRNHRISMAPSEPDTPFEGEYESTADTAVIRERGGAPPKLCLMSDSSHEHQSFETRAIHAGNTADPLTGAVVPPIYQVSTYRRHCSLSE